MKKCKSEFHTKIHETLFIKYQIKYLLKSLILAKINCQLYANGFSFLLSSF